MYNYNRSSRSNCWSGQWTVFDEPYRDALVEEANTKLRGERSSFEVLSVLAWLRDANEGLKGSKELSIVSSIETTLWSVARMGVVISDPGRVREYLVIYSDMTGMLLPMGEALMAHFRGEAQISLEVFQDPDADDEFLMFTIRRASYPENILDQIDSIVSSFEEPLSVRDGWVLITTDFSPPR